MGILLNAAYLMMVEGKRRPFSGTVLQLGRQSVLFSYPALQGLAAQVPFDLHPVEGIDPAIWMNDEQFFKSMGFDQVMSMEFGTEEKASLVWDLNKAIPDDLVDTADFIYDGGTIEHVFDIATAMTNVCRMLRVGARVMHENGVTGGIDHGFYAIQPTFYHDFYTANGFDINLQTVSKLETSKWLTHTGTQRLYVPGQYDYFACFEADAGFTSTGICFATKREQWTGLVIPQQSIWGRAAKVKD